MIEYHSSAHRFMQRYADRYCYFGGTTVKNESSGTQQSTQSNTVDPQQMAMLQDNLAGAKQRASTLTPFTGQMVAGFNPTQTQAQGVLSGIGTNPTYGNTNTGAIQGAQGVLGANYNSTITPQSVTPSTVSASPVSAGMLANTDLSPYENPYTKDVINASVAQNEQARKIAQVSDAQTATAQGAFGGSRSGVAAGVTNGQYDLNDQNFIANQNANNFSQAQAAATGDINRKYGADTFNAGQDLTAQTTNQNAGIQTGEFNSTASADAQKATFANQLAANGLTLNAAGQIVSLNNAALGTAATQGGILGAVGDAQQQQQQASLSAAYQAYMDGQQLTVEQQRLLDSALGLVPVQQTVSGSGSSTGNSTQTQSGGLGSMLGGLLGGIGSLGTGLGAQGIKLSDSRTKSDVETIGHDERGRRWVAFRYNWEQPGTQHVGVIAQEVLDSDPDAVLMGNDGLYRVDYSKLGGMH